MRWTGHVAGMGKEKAREKKSTRKIKTEMGG
jgi:hypothetical protein